MPLDNETVASNPGNVSLSKKKLKYIYPEITSWKYIIFRLIYVCQSHKTLRSQINDCMMDGDCNPAVVISTSPLLVSAYSENMDCAVLIRYPDSFVKRYNLKSGTRLLSVNTYCESNLFGDMNPGPEYTGVWNDFQPRIAEFVSDDNDIIEQNKKIFTEKDWKKTWDYGILYTQTFPQQARDGYRLLGDLLEY